MADTIMQPTLEDIAQAFGLEPDAPLQPPRFAKVTAVADATVTVTLGTQTVEAVRCCVCSAGDVVLLETLPSGRLAAVGTRGATSTTYTAGTGLTLSGTTINHSNAVTAGTIGTSSATSGATIAVPYATYDAQGHITGKGTHTHTVNGINLASAVTGTLPIANGGTGATTAGAAAASFRAAESCIVGSNTATAGWIKFASVTTLATNQNAIFNFMVTRSFTSGGCILHCNFRQETASGSIYKFAITDTYGNMHESYFLVRPTYNSGSTSCTFDMFWYQQSQYDYVRFQLLDTGNRQVVNYYIPTLYNSSTFESSTPSGTASTSALLGANTNWFGTCNTSQSSSVKTVACDGFVLTKFAKITVAFQTNNTQTGSLYMNVNNTGQYPIAFLNVSAAAGLTWNGGEQMTFIFDGSAWYLDSPFNVMRSRQSFSGTIEDAVEEVRRTAGVCGSISLTSAYTFGSNTIATGWYCYEYIPHRFGMQYNDNVQYGVLLLFSMTSNNGDWKIRVANGAVSQLKAL